MMREPVNEYENVKSLNIPVKIWIHHTGSVWGDYYYYIDFPTLGIRKSVPLRKSQQMKELMEFLEIPCEGKCRDCKHWRYPIKCYKFEDWEKERDKK